MKRVLLLGMAVLLLLPLTACMTPFAETPEHKRMVIDNMRAETLTKIYVQRPASEGIISRAAGYAVFSNVNAQVLFAGGGGGYGVAVDQSSGQKTYMKMAQVGLGPGLGIQDIRVVFVFHSERALYNFIDLGWEFGGQADASAKAGEKGVASTGEFIINAETSVYTLTESGLMAKVNLAGTKYWKDASLNFLP